MKTCFCYGAGLAPKVEFSVAVKMVGSLGGAELVRGRGTVDEEEAVDEGLYA